MLKVNVGLSRKLGGMNYSSTGFSINLDGEITAAVADPEAVVEQVKELYDLAEEALNQQIERYQSDSAIASRDEEPRANGGENGHSRPTTNGASRREPPARSNPPASANGQNRCEPPSDAATNKQLQYLLSLGKRHKLTTVQLEQRIEEVLGQPIGIYDLSKRDAAAVIDTLTGNGVGGQTASGRR